MKRSNVDKAYDHIKGIYRNYPDWPCTFNPCRSEECENKAIGVGYCADCHTKKLAQYVAPEMAKSYHDAVKKKSRLASTIMELIRVKELKED